MEQVIVVMLVMVVMVVMLIIMAVMMVMISRPPQSLQGASCFMLIAVRTPGIVKGNKSLNLVWFK